MSLETGRQQEFDEPALEAATDAAAVARGGMPRVEAPRSEFRQVDADDPAGPDEYDAAYDYRAVATPAVAALILGLLSPLAFFDWLLGLIPLAAIVLGVIGLRRINRQPEMYTGRALSVIGLVLAVLCWSGGAAWLSYVYATEVPEGYERISYAQLQPGPNDPPDSISDEAQSLDGKKVFLKGYVYPGLRTEGINLFLLVRDQGSCCFGGNPKITDRVQVRLADPKGFRFSSRLFKVAGVFRIAPPVEAVDASGAVFYFLDDAMLR